MQVARSKESGSPDPMPRMGLSRLVLHQFRNYPELDLTVETGTIVLTGPNGAGKTNILEAISFLSPGRGLRSVKLSQVTNLKKLNQDASNPPLWAISATLDTKIGPVQLGTGLENTASGNERRLIKINGQAAKSQACLTDWINVIWLTPQMDRLFLEAASVRRKFIDRLVYALDANHAARIHRYEHHVRERAHLLREGRYDPLWISTLERHIAEDGVAIAIARQQTMKSIEEAQRHDKLYPFPQFRAEMKGDVEILTESLPALAVEDMYVEKLRLGRTHDGEVGGACIGPHRSDLQVHHLAKQLPAELCSTGEQKMLLLAITLAFVRIQENYRNGTTVLLLDDIAAHLDDQHRQILFQEICGSNKDFSQEESIEPYQVWMTGTDKAAFQHLTSRAQFLTVQNATLTNG